MSDEEQANIYELVKDLNIEKATLGKKNYPVRSINDKWFTMDHRIFLKKDF